MQRCEFIAALAGSVAAAPTLRLRAAFAQQAEKVRHIGVLMGLSESDPDVRGVVAAFEQELARSGWIVAAMCGSTGGGQMQIYGGRSGNG